MNLGKTLYWQVTVSAAAILLLAGAARAQCVGDCNEDGQVTVNELITGVGIALGSRSTADCPSFDSDQDGAVRIPELITAVGNALNGCPSDCADCDDGDTCTTDLCVDGECVHDAVVCEDDGEECTLESCDPEFGCVRANAQDGTACGGGAGSCQSGVCVVPGEVEYEQSFETLDRTSETALADDGWVVFGNVFDGETGAYRYGYGTFPAPNGGPAFAAIDAGQGGPEQGEQQLSVYSDYDNADHADGDLIESNLFREREITADDVGNTITFGFDAKRGNINDPTDPLCPCESTASAFIKTVNPAAGFATTNLVQEDTTAIPDTWGRYTLTLAIDAALEGQLLQVGFSCRATLYQPSGVFYDNLQVSSAPTIP